MRITSSRTLVLGLVLPLALAACKKRDEPAPAPPPAAAPASTAPTVAGITVGKGIGADKRVLTAATEFGVRDTVAVSVMTRGSGQAVPIVARWTFGDSTLVRADTITVDLSGDDATAFHISRPRAWPAGSYKVDIALNGAPAGSRTFTIR